MQESAKAASTTSHPGITDGPADAYRHMMGIAETTRRYGQGVASVAGLLNEVKPTSPGASRGSDSQMDLHNNKIGERIGKIARSPEEAAAMVEAEIRAAAIEGGSGKNGTAKWLDREQWREESDDRQKQTIWPPTDLAKSSEVERILGKPVDLWTKRDVELVQRDPIYTNSNHPRQQATFEKVRLHFKREYDRPQAERGGGPVQVRPYTRDDGTAVDGHSRAAPALRGR